MAGKTKKKKGRSRKVTPERSGDILRILRVATGIFFAFAAIYTLVALFSYFFTWTVDQSLAFDPDYLKNDISAANSGGKLGWRWADFLVSTLFGFGALAIPFLLGAVSVVCFRIKKVNLLRISISTLFGAIIISVACAYLFTIFCGDNLLGSGAGGSYGHYASDWLCSMLGTIGAGLVILFVIFIFIALQLPKAAFWFDDMIYGISHRERVPNEGQDADDTFEDSGEESIGEIPLADSDLPVEEEEPDVVTEEIVNGPDVEEESSEVAPPAAEDQEVPLEIEESENDYIGNLSDDEWRHRYDPRLDLPYYKQPPLSLLLDYREQWYDVTREELENNKQRIVNALDSYKIKVTKITAKMGPTVTLYKIYLAEGVKVAQVRNLEEDIAISLGAKGVRVVTLLDSVGIEVANEKPSVVALKAVLNSPQFKDAKMDLPLALGITVTNEPFFVDLAKMPHLLVAGATGMGKSVGLNAMIATLLYTKHPAEMKFVLVDPKKVELSLYSKLDKHFLAQLPDADEAIITDTKKVVNTLKSLCIEMDNRYDLLKLADVRQIREYNEKFLSRRLNPEKGHKFLPYIVVIIDEFADLLMTAGREIEEPIARLAQKARAVGIHLVIATQRPTTNIITGTIKANFNSRVAFKVNSSIDSKTIIDATGANRLIGRGDMLVVHPGADLTRVQCALIDTDEIKNVVKYISSQKGYPQPFELPEYVDENDDGSDLSTVDLHKRDALFEECAKLVVQYQQGSTSMIQRKLGLGYARAGRIMDQLETAGIVGPQEGSKARSVLVTDFSTLDNILESLNHI